MADGRTMRRKSVGNPGGNAGTWRRPAARCPSIVRRCLSRRPSLDHSDRSSMDNKQSCNNNLPCVSAKSSRLSRLIAAIGRLSYWPYPKPTHPRYLWRPRWWAGGVGLCCGAIDLGYQILTQEYFPELNRRSMPYISWAGLGVVPGILAVWLPFEISRVYRKERHHNNLCRSCGYDLRKLTADRCPECGCPDLAESRRQLEQTYGFLWIGALFRAFFSRRDKQEVDE